jgi:hypothetical protein
MSEIKENSISTKESCVEEERTSDTIMRYVDKNTRK